MNWDQVEGQWKQLGAEVKAKWAKLTDDDVKLIAAKKDAFVGKLQERYGVRKEEAERQVNQWIKDLKPRHSADATDPDIQPPMRH